MHHILHFPPSYALTLSIRFINPVTLRPPTASPALEASEATAKKAQNSDQGPPGTVKSILPCTPLAIVKVLEHIGVYNKMLAYGDRARGKVITVINRSEVVGRPLAALLANDGARVLSVDIDCECSPSSTLGTTSAFAVPPFPSPVPLLTTAIVEFSKRPHTDGKYNPHHITTPTELTLKDCLAISDVIIGAVPNKDYKVPTSQLKDGCICVNVAGEKNFEADVRDRAGIYVPSVGMMTIAMLQRNL